MRAKLKIGPDGEVTAPQREAEGLGLAGGGEIDLVSARGAFALLVPAREDAPHAYFAGSLAALTVPEVVQFVFTTLKTGVLLLAFGEAGASASREGGPERLRRKSIYFRDGQVVFASSSDPADRLGPVLLGAGLVPPAELERCSRLVRSGRPLGQVLVDEGVLTAGQVYEGVTLQVKEILLGAFLEAEGEFAFLEGPFDESNAVKLPQRTRELLLEGMRRRDAWEQARAADGVAGAEPVIEIQVEAPRPADPPPRVAGATGPFDTYRRILKRVVDALSAAQPDAIPRLNSWFDRQPANKRAVFDGVRIGEDGEMDVAQVLVNVTSSGQYRGAAARARSLEALEELLAFALFEVKNRMPKADAEALLREVGRMQVGKA